MKKIKSCIKACGIHLPSTIIKSDDLFEDIKSDTNYGIPLNWMSETMGIVERRVAPITTKPSDLAIPAAEEAIANWDNAKPDEIDLVIFCGMERDQTEPATAHTIQHALKLNASYVFDVSNACFGFINGMQIANDFIASGSVRSALIVTGEVTANLSRSVIKQLKSGLEANQAKEILGFLSLGDAGGAVIISKTQEKEESGFELFNSNINSSHRDKCYYGYDHDGEVNAKMQMSRMVAYGFKLHTDILDKTLKLAGWHEFDWLLSHQTGKRSFQQIIDLDIIKRNRMVKSYQHLGNVTSATFAINYYKLTNSGLISKGDKIGGFFAGSGLTAGQFAYTY